MTVQRELHSFPAPPDSVIGKRVRLTRTVLPPLIVLVVVLYELLVARLGNPQSELWAHLLFYGLVGPLVTFFTITWLEEGFVAREHAERELRHLYGELRASHSQLDTVQSLIRTLAEAADLEEVLEVAVAGVVRATGATHAKLRLQGGLERTARGNTLLEAPSADLHEVALPLTIGRELIGQLTLHFAQLPSTDTIRLAGALGAEVGTAIEAARRRTQDLITLYEVDQSIRAERNMRRLLERVTENMAARSGARARAVFLVDEDGVLRRVWEQDLTGLSHRGGSVPPFAKRVAHAAEPVLADGDEAQSVFAGARSVLGVPMHSEEHLIGVIVLGHDDAHAFERARIPLLALMANQATLAVRNARAYFYSEELAIGEERNRIAREIHDGVAQSLAFCALKLDVAERQIDKDPRKAAQEIALARTILREQIREVRRSIFALRPIDLERFGLLETMRRYVKDFGEQNNLRTHLDIEGEVNLSPSDEAVLFRILQESLNNVAKHARARDLSVRLVGGERVHLEILDDGVGFDLETVTGRVSSAGGLGLAQMRERVESRGGHYSVVSAPGHGTRVTARLPQA